MRTIFLRPLGKLDSGDINYTKKIIEDFFGYEVKVKTEVKITESMLNSSNQLNTTSSLFELKNNYLTIYVTNLKLRNNYGLLLRGVTSVDKLKIIVRGEPSFLKSTLIHEIGHSIELKHCKNLKCVMAMKNDKFDSGKFCQNCFLKITESEFKNKKTNWTFSN